MDIFKIIQIINIAGIIQGFILSAAVFHGRKRGGKSLIYLALLIMVFSVGNLANIIVHYFLGHYYWHKFLMVPFYVAIGPAFYLYVAEFTDYNIKLPKAVHFLVFIIISHSSMKLIKHM